MSTGRFAPPRARGARLFLGVLLLALPVAILSRSGVPTPRPADAEWKLPAVPMPPENVSTPPRVELGKALFFDPRLSGNGATSCASCHNPSLGWSDGLKTGIGFQGTVLKRATPTIVNLAYNTQFMWDGRHRTLEEQALGPMRAADEMNTDFPALLQRLRALEGYVRMFDAAYPGEGITEQTLAKALAAFERSVVSRDSPFDRWLQGDAGALGPSQWRGFQVFLDPAKGNCAACHAAPNFTDNGFHNIGVKDMGVRWDYESNMINNDFRTPPELVAGLESACRTYGEPVGGQSTWCLRDFLDLDRYTTDGNDRDAYYGMVQPRLGFAWDVRGNAKTVVFGGWGKYYDRVILNDIFDEQYRQQYRIFSFCFSEDGSPAPNCGVPALAWDPSFLSGEALRQLVASGQAPGPEVFLVDNEMRPPRSDQWTLGVRHQLGNWLTSLSYAGTRGYNNLMYFFGDLPPGTQFGDRFGNNVQVPGYARVFVTSTARRTWYDALFLTLDRPIAVNGKWGFNLAYTYAEAEQTGTDNPGEGVAFGAFDYLDSDSLYRFPGTNDERHRLVMSGTVALPGNFQVSSLITLGSGVPFTIFDDSVAPFTVRWNEGRPEQDDFIIPDTWAYRSVDLRLEWQAPPIANAVRVSLIGEGFNVFDFDNGGCFESFRPRLPAVNARFGEPNCEFNTRRLQAGLRVEF